MAIYGEDIVNIDLNEGSLCRNFMSCNIGVNGVNANRIGVRVYRDKEPVDLTGVSCTGYFKKADGDVVTLEGTASENIAYVTLTNECYTVSGKFTLAIKLILRSTKVTARIVDGVIVTTSM